MELYNLVMVPFKTILKLIQNGATHPINCTGSKALTIRAMGTKNIGLAPGKYYSYIVQATSIYKYYKTCPKVSQRIYLPEIYIFTKKKASAFQYLKLL